MRLLQGIRTKLRSAAITPAVDLATVPSEQLRLSHAAGQALQAVAADLAAEGRSVLDVVLNGNAFEAWQMYPWQGGILDQRTDSQYFYHAHADYSGEHGHFHTFIYHQRKLVHLVAIGMDARGRINALYTFNRWGPGDHYHPADTLKSFVPKFHIRTGKGENALDARLHAFVNHTLALFAPELGHLFDERDATFARYRAEHGGAEPYEDRALEITSRIPADVDVQMERIAAELRRRREPLPEPLAATLSGAPAASNGGNGMRAHGKATGAAEEFSPTPMAERTTSQLQRSHAAGLAFREAVESLKAKGGILAAVMNGKAHEVWEMYPWDGGVIDKKTRSQYFYHTHPQSPEHGHFHVFYHHRKELAHLGAIALDNAGEPIRLFTTNRWVTDEFYLPAEKLREYTAQFRITNDAYDAPVNAFVGHLLRLYQVELDTLMQQRDGVYADYRARHDGRSPFEDRDLEITSTLGIDVESQITALENELRSRGEL